MIADELGSALRNAERASEVAQCKREENFREMYAALGDEGRQREIREANKDKHHCMFLKESCEACIALPESGGPYAGKICPNNPWEREADLFEELEQQGPLLQHAHYLQDLAELGFLPRPEMIDPLDWEIVRIMHQNEKVRNLQMGQVAAMQTVFGGKTE